MTIMQYLLLLYADETGGKSIPPEEMAKYMAQMGAYQEALAKAGAFVASNALETTDTAFTVSVREGQVAVHDGPYAETREQLGGYYIIDVPDIDAARAWAARCPGASWGSVEVRQIVSIARDRPELAKAMGLSGQSCEEAAR